MKVLLAAPYFHPHVGGVETYTAHLARNLRELGWTVAVVTASAPELDAAPGPDDGRRYQLRPLATLSNTPVGLNWRRQLRLIIERERPDVINGHMPVPYLADLAQRASGSTPFVLTYHNDLAKQHPLADTAARLAHQLLINRTLAASTRIITTSDYYALQSPYLKPYGPKTDTVPPGVDWARFNPGIEIGAGLAARFAGKRVVLFVGSLNQAQQHKGLGVLLAAFAAIRPDSPDVELVVVGGGDGQDMYRARARAAGVGDAVCFTGYVSDDELAQYYRLATVFAMPSTNRSEGFGLVYLEAGAAGTPVVGSRIGGVPYAIRDNETGLLVEPGSAESLAAALRRILDDPDLARRLGQAGSQRARRDFDWRQLAAQTGEIFRCAAAGQPGSLSRPGGRPAAPV
jgi:glycosyltransferase involved in cell wall biosynthesis